MKSSIFRKAYIIAALFFMVQYIVFKIMMPNLPKPIFLYLFIGINFGIGIGISTVAIINRLTGLPKNNNIHILIFNCIFYRTKRLLHD